jgi:hypothetical protein
VAGVRRWLSSSALLLAGFWASDCADPLDLCSPIAGRVGFFSQGDCLLVRSGFFQGHEWLTYFGNDALPADKRFAPGEVQRIASGNRRVDWPSELLVYLDHSVYAYLKAVIRHTDRDDNQAVHFLLRSHNTEEEAITEAREEIYQSTLGALRLWTDNRLRALALIGRANHTIQDSFSDAHSVRDSEHEDYGSPACRGRCGCIRRVKAYTPRLDGYRAGVLFHGGRADLDVEHISGDNIGHSTEEDSIYQPTRGCRSPSGQQAVEACLNASANAAVVATSDYLTFVLDQLRAGNSAAAVDEALLRDNFATYVTDHLARCDELPEE